MLLFLTILFLAALHCGEGYDDDDEFVYSHYLNHNVLLEWKYEGYVIIMRLSAETTSWIGVGLSPNGTMEDADIIIGGVYRGEGYLYDAYAWSNRAPELRGNATTLISFREENQTTSLTFKRRLGYTTLFNSNMKWNDMNVIWAFGFNDMTGSPTSLNYHAWRRGTMKVDFNPEFRNDEFKYSEELHKDVTLDWYYNSSQITFRFSAPSRGWVGFGFSPNGTMTGGDMVMGGVNWGRPFCFDAHSFEDGPPIRDEEQTTEVFRVSREGKRTTLVVRMQMDMIGKYDLSIDNMSVIWAHGPLNILYEQPRYFNYHLWNRGAKKIRFLRNEDFIEIERQPGVSVIVLDDPEVIMKYSIRGTDIIVELTAPTTGWVGLGYSMTGWMTGADLVIAGVNKSSQGYLWDAFAYGNSPPEIDYYQDVRLISASEDDDRTTVKFERSLFGLSSRNDRTISGNEYIIWAYGSEDMTDPPGWEHFHGRNKGAVRLQLAENYFS